MATNDASSAPNAGRLLWAGFFAILATGVGFGIRTGVLRLWATEYGFTSSDLGVITGQGLAGFGFVIILCSLVADKIGYGRLMVLAFIMHLLSAALQLSTGAIYEHFGREATYYSLYGAMFLFAVGNGICEGVVNPMVATLYTKDKTHYLNILHAGWPAGLMLGGVISYIMNKGNVGSWQPFPNGAPWIWQMSMYLLPVLLYGLLMIGQRFPRSEASQAGVSFSTMLLEIVSPILLLLVIAQALLGYVELGTDSWISSLTGAIMADDSYGLLLFIYASTLMFILRFMAGPIVHAISPMGLLLFGAIFGAIGLTLLSNAVGIVMCVVAMTVYALGKTFLWPTMLAVVSDRFPKGGAITIGLVGGIGMLSAGYLGGPGIGFKQDYYASHELKEKSPESYDRYAAGQENSFHGLVSVKGLDGAKVGVLANNAKQLELDVQIANEKKIDNEATKAQRSLLDWWHNTAESHKSIDAKPVEEAGLFGSRMALKLTAAVPATMAVIYLLLLLYFKARGGYKRVELESRTHAPELGVTPAEIERV